MACARFRNKQLNPPMHLIKALISTLVVLLASMVVVGWAEAPSGDYSIELVHVDAHRGFSNDELMRRAANRSRLRVATMYPQASAASGRPAPLPPSIQSPGGLCLGEAEYYMKFYIGGAKDATSAMMDTGSDIIWMTEQECKTLRGEERLRCDDHMCKSHADCGCDSEDHCQYVIKYGDSNEGKTVEGHMYKGKLSFLLSSAPGRSKTSYSEPMDVAFGCSTGKHFPGCSSPPMRGVVGLGRGGQSLPEQLKVKNFSYCLNNYTNPNLKSILLFNNTTPDLAKGKRRGATVVTTPLSRHPEEAWYFVHLEDISIGPTRLHIPAVHPQKQGGSGGNMFIDSGASYTFLQEDAFEKVVKELDRIMVKDKRLVKTSSGDNMNCYSGKPDASMPKLKLHFANSADMELPWESYLWHHENEKESSMCLAIKKRPKVVPGNNYHVLGNFQQQSMHMLFDIENEQLKFVQANCSKVL